MTAERDIDASVGFLQRYRPTGPWVLTAIAPDKTGIETRTFMPATEGELRAWLERWVGTRNVYFEVNPPTRELTKKAERTDIAAVEWLHVDIDPRAGESIDEERTRILARLTTNLPTGVPAPTIVVFSGGGYQGFWKLAEPIAIDGELERAESAKLFNLQLERLFGADNCHNVDRIMRLPGTINIPDAKKLKKGRVATTAAISAWSAENIYPISAFTAAQPVQGGDEGIGDGPQLEISGNVARISIEDLDSIATAPVPEWCKVLIVQGRDPENPTKYESRSNALWAVVCCLVRCGVSDESVFAVITDPDFAISESVLDKGSNTRRYALKQIRDAKENAIDPWLHKMNSRFAVIGQMGGACRVIEEVEDTLLDRTEFAKQSFQDFRNRWMHIKIECGEDAKGNKIKKEVGEWWLHHPQRRQYDGIVFSPGHDVKGHYNLWRGFACEAIPGDCGLFLAHVRDNVCSGVEEHYQYLMRWLARAVQFPAEQGHTAVVMRGKEGTGKSFFADTVGSLFGRHYVAVSNAEHVTGKFNSHLRDAVIVFGDEAFYAGDKQHEGILKALITQDTIRAESKFIDSETVRNHTHLILASNNTWIVPAGPEARRYFVLEVGSERMQSRPYFGAIAAQLNAGGREALLHHLLTLDISDFDVRDVPKTKALQEQKLLSLNTEQDWWFKKLVNGAVLPARNGWDRSVRCTDLVDDYVNHAQRHASYRRSTETGLGLFLQRVCPAGYPRKARVRENGGRVMAYELPSLAACRKHWDENFGGPFEWLSEGEEKDEQTHF